MRKILLCILFLIAFSSIGISQNSSRIQISEGITIDSVQWEGERVNVIIDSEIAVPVSVIDLGAFTGSGIQKIEPKRLTISPGKSNISMETSPSSIGRGISLSIGEAIIPIKRSSGGILPEASKFRMIISAVSGVSISLLIAFLWVRRERRKTEKSVKRVL